MTNADFAKRAARLSCLINQWAADALDDQNGQFGKEALARFTKEVRDRLDHLARHDASGQIVRPEGERSE